VLPRPPGTQGFGSGLRHALRRASAPQLPSGGTWRRHRPVPKPAHVRLPAPRCHATGAARPARAVAGRAAQPARRHDIRTLGGRPSMIHPDAHAHPHAHCMHMHIHMHMHMHLSQDMCMHIHGHVHVPHVMCMHVVHVRVRVRVHVHVHVHVPPRWTVTFASMTCPPSRPPPSLC
jgi:hypothetical protein